MQNSIWVKSSLLSIVQNEQQGNLAIYGPRVRYAVGRVGSAVSASGQYAKV